MALSPPGWTTMPNDDDSNDEEEETEEEALPISKKRKGDEPEAQTQPKRPKLQHNRAAVSNPELVSRPKPPVATRRVKRTKNEKARQSGLFGEETPVASGSGSISAPVKTGTSKPGTQSSSNPRPGQPLARAVTMGGPPSSTAPPRQSLPTPRIASTSSTQIPKSISTPVNSKYLAPSV